MFTPVANANGNAYASFTFQVQDNGGGSNLDLSANTLTINVTSVNDAPVAVNGSDTVAEDAAVPLAIDLTALVSDVEDVDRP